MTPSCERVTEKTPSTNQQITNKSQIRNSKYSNRSLAAGFWRLVSGFWSLVAGRWFLVPVYYLSFAFQNS
jgi:hypothetical protein